MPLTHDHHHALAQARRLKIAAKGDGAERLRQGREFVDFFHADSVNHFREEEEIVFPLAIEDERAEALLTEVVRQHLHIHAQVQHLEDAIACGDVTVESISEVATTLETHIRLEENKVFPLLQEVVSEKRWADVALQERKRGETDGH